jgi:hypothetical protein
MLPSKTLSHQPTGPAFGRPEDRFRPVPIAEIDPGLRREDEAAAERGFHGQYSQH